MKGQPLASRERTGCEMYLESSSDERPLEEFVGRTTEPFSLIVAQGFEERSVGVIETLAKTGVCAQDVFIGDHSRHEEANGRYAKRFDNAARAVCAKPCSRLPLDYGGAWVNQALEQCIGAIGNRTS